MAKMASFFLLGDFEINHLNFYFLASNSIFPYISQPRRLTSHSKALTGNIFWSLLISDMISGNLTATVSNHLPRLLFAPNILSSTYYNKSSTFERDWSKFNKENLRQSYLDKNWSDVLQFAQQNLDLFIEFFLNILTPT